MNSDFFPVTDMWWGTLGTVRPFPNFQPDGDAEVLAAALERKDVGTLVRILTNRNNAQRLAIDKRFKELTEQSLSKALKKVVSGDMEDLLLQLMMRPEMLDAQRLKRAMSALGTDEETLLEILCSHSRSRVGEISAVYKQQYKKKLEEDLRDETSGDFAKLLTALLRTDVSSGSVQSDVQTLAASLGGKKADPEPLINVLTSRSSDHLNKVLMELELETGQMVDQLLEKRFSGDFRLGLRVLVQCIQNPEVYLARRLVSMKTSLLHGIMVSRSEEDLLSIRAAFFRLTGSSLYSTLQKHFKGEHLQALLAICRSED